MATGSVSWGSQSETAQAIEGNDDLKPENLLVTEAGTLKGMVSSTNMDKVKRSMAYAKVKVEGAQIVTVMKMTGHNGSNSNAPPGQQLAPSQTKVICMG